MTGHTGFKGSWLTLWLLELGARVYGYALDPPTDPNLFTLAQIGPRLREDGRHDVRDGSALQRAMNGAEPEIVFHLAAQPLVRKSYEAAIETFDVNVMGTAKVLQSALRVPSVKAVIVVTTDKCYENLGGAGPYKETDAMGGADPYSASKACAEIVASSFRASAAALGAANQNIRIATVRAGNVFGGGDWSSDRLVPDCIRAFASGEPVRLRYPKAVRPWLYVLDALSGYLMLAEQLLQENSQGYAGAFNFGPPPDNEAKVEHVASLLARSWGDVTIETNDGPHPPEALVLRLDSSKARKLLGWRETFSLAEGLHRTAKWYKDCYARQDIGAMSVRQLADFQQSLA
jgi:CDP-glucose 4,6-dehydratase